MTILGVHQCRHGRIRQWEVEATPDDPVPAIQFCPVCDKNSKPLPTYKGYAP
jgi:hypothetical protein